MVFKLFFIRFIHIPGGGFQYTYLLLSVSTCWALVSLPFQFFDQSALAQVVLLQLLVVFKTCCSLSFTRLICCSSSPMPLTCVFPHSVLFKCSDDPVHHGVDLFVGKGLLPHRGR